MPPSIRRQSPSQTSNIVCSVRWATPSFTSFSGPAVAETLPPAHGVLRMASEAIYPGSFDPLTNGHLSIIHRGLRLFDRLTIAVANNPNKAPLFTVEERMAFIRQVLSKERRVSVDSFDGLLTAYARDKGVHVILRGLRAV